MREVGLLLGQGTWSRLRRLLVLNVNNNELEKLPDGLGELSPGSRNIRRVVKVMDRFPHGCCWETFHISAYCGLVVEIQPRNCQDLDVCLPTSTKSVGKAGT